MFSANLFSNKQGLCSLLVLSVWISTIGLVQSDDPAPADLTSPVSPQLGQATGGTLPTGTGATSAGTSIDTTAVTSVGKPSGTDPSTSGLLPASGATTGASVGTSLNSTWGSFPASLQDGNGKKIVFPITDPSGRVIFQSVADVPTSKLENSTLSSSKAPGAKKAAKANSGNLLVSSHKSLVASLSMGVVMTLFA
ncbi:hypothetical protein PCASD_22175 [Puccinia coronata f. sp. avenae]|uniref:Uncharacterized protein n=1 Tax=Puccinia coronata f. sp. avenae TaxID=200324 RepID=A0A2N5SR32_9BASI|nr:hypothetical protein PCASD_22175 [Puccinia coronata f. sp. avenae]